MRTFRILISCFIILLCITSAFALTIEIEGNFVNEKVRVTLDENALIIFRMNHGTPIFAEGKNASFIPHITGELYVEAISKEERVNRTIKIVRRVSSEGGGSGSGGNYALPDGSFTKKAHNTNALYTVNWRTALGALEKATEILGFDYTVKDTALGIYVDCIRGKCEKSEGEKSGWKYWVNYPYEDSPSLRSDEYELKEGDTVVWYFAKSIEDKPGNSAYRIEITVNSGFIIGVTSHWRHSSENEKRTYTYSYTKEPHEGREFFKSVVLLPGIEKKVQIPKNFVSKFGITSLKLISPERKEVEVKIEKASAVFHYGGIYRSFRIDGVEGLSGSIEFRVSKDWIEENNYSIDQIKLVKFLNDGFTEVPVNYTGQDAEYFYFESELESFSTFAIVSKWRDFPLNAEDERIVKALKWLRSAQNDDGGFSNPGENSSVSKTSWAILALAAANQNPNEWLKNNVSPIDYIRENLKDEIDIMGTTDYALVILALKSVGENPEDFSNVNLIEKLKSKVKKNGQIGDFIHTTIWGILALKACGEDVNQSLKWLKSIQNKDGGFGWAIGERSDYDDTAAAIQALIAAGEPRDSDVIRKALRYLRTGQNEDGGFRYFGTSASNAASDAWVIQALIAAGINPVEWRKNNVSVVEHLLSLQTDEGYFKYTSIEASNPGYMTVCAIMALTGAFHPIKAQKYRTVIEEFEYERGTEKQEIVNFTEDGNKMDTGGELIEENEGSKSISVKITTTHTPKGAPNTESSTMGILLTVTLAILAVALIAYFRRK